MSLAVVELGQLGFDEGAHVLIKLALADRNAVDPADRSPIGVAGSHVDLLPDLAAWCRSQGHRCRRADASEGDGVVAILEPGPAATAAQRGAQRAGHADFRTASAVAECAPDHWGLAPRGALIEPGGPAPHFRLNERDAIWTERAAQFYAQGLAAQWDPSAAIDWSVSPSHGQRVEAGVIQVMTYLIENEEAALVVPARFLGQVHPHYREIQQMLALIVGDEARHIEVFTRRATLGGRDLALSSAGARASLQTLLDEPDFAIASFLLSVMGEGTFVALLGFLERYAPDPLTRRIAHLTRKDEARHVAFGMAHLERHCRVEPDLRGRLARAVERRHSALQSTAGLNDEVFDALVLLAGGADTPDRIAIGWRRVQALQHEMSSSREARLARLGFSKSEAEVLSSLHTRNFM
jgi:hypothetical protein